MLRRWREGSLQTAIIISFTLMVSAVLLTVMLGLAAQTKNLIRDDAVARTRQTVIQGKASLGIYVSGMLETMALFKSLVGEAAEVRSQSLAEHMELVNRQHSDVSCLSVFSQGGDVLASTEEAFRPPYAIRDTEWFQRALKARSSTVSISQPYLQDAYTGQYAWVVTLSTQVQYVRMGRTETGLIAMDIRFSAFEHLLSDMQLGDSGYVYLLGADYGLIYHSQQPLIEMGLKHENIDQIRKTVIGDFFDTMDGRERFTVVQTVNNTRWRLVGVAYMDEATAGMGKSIKMIVTFLAAGLLMALSVAILLGRLIARPVNRLTDIMRVVEGGNLDVEIPQHGFSEIANLASAFRLMLGHLKLLMNQIVLEQEQKRLYELDALQAQINPHFLYNTLDSIVWMQERGQNRDAISMVTALARLFRISISKGKSIITVAEEIEHVRNYLIIQSIRFKSKFTYAIDAEPEALALRTVKLVLQPIVENAIVHGLAFFAADEGLIAISARVEDAQLVLRVRDNGLGMSATQMADVLKAHKGNGIGLRNVHERIVLTYGSQYGVSIQSEQDVGTLVTIRQPATKGEGTP